LQVNTYADTNIRVTGSHVAASKVSYPLHKISKAYFYEIDKQHPLKGWLFLIGIVSLIVALGEFNGHSFLVAVSVAIIIISIAIKPKYTYTYELWLMVSGFEKKVLSSKDKEYINKLVEIINTAIGKETYF
jgi:uncharacterized membrane protein